MKLFFEICKEFFDMVYLPFVSDIIENEIIREELDEELHEEFDEEKGFIEQQENWYNAENQDNEYIQDDEQKNIQYNQEKQDIKLKKDMEENVEDNNEDFCGCEFFIQTLSIINARIYKQLHNNKSE